MLNPPRQDNVTILGRDEAEDNGYETPAGQSALAGNLLIAATGPWHTALAPGPRAHLLWQLGAPGSTDQAGAAGPDE